MISLARLSRLPHSMELSAQIIFSGVHSSTPFGAFPPFIAGGCCPLSATTCPHLHLSRLSRWHVLPPAPSHPLWFGGSACCTMVTNPYHSRDPVLQVLLSPRSSPSQTFMAGTLSSGRHTSAASGALTGLWGRRTTSPSECSRRTSRYPSHLPGHRDRTRPVGRSSTTHTTVPALTSCCGAPAPCPPRCCGPCTTRRRLPCANGAWSAWR